jgi:hypothetical protein
MNSRRTFLINEFDFNELFRIFPSVLDFFYDCQRAVLLADFIVDRRKNASIRPV